MRVLSRSISRTYFCSVTGTGTFRTKQEKDSARRNALDAKVNIGTKNDTMKVYMTEIARIPLVNKKEEAELADDIHGGDDTRHDDARTTLIKANLRLVVKIAHDFKGNPSMQDDRLTERVHQACKVMDIQLVDHIIVCRGGRYYSYNDHGKLL